MQEKGDSIGRIIDNMAYFAGGMVGLIGYKACFFGAMLHVAGCML